MKPRMDFRAASPAASKALGALHGYVAQCGLDHVLLELVKLRASQINGCAHCLDMHAKRLREAGQSEERIFLLDAWREAPIYSERERTALAWTEAVTLVTHGHVPDAVYAEARAAFSDKELVNLTVAVVTINAANRMNIAFRTVPGGTAASTRHAAE